MKKILITGGAGFVGSHLAKKLIGEGNQVFCLDNFSTSNKENIAELMENTQFSLIEQDVVTPLKIQVDEIYNLACPASPIHYQSDPVGTMKTSIYGAINMLELAKVNGAKILQASTSEIYGDPEVSPQPETYLGKVNPIGIRACYDEGKRSAETLFFDYWRKYQVDIRVVRIFNTYGPNMQINDGRVVSNFIVQALRNEPITIYGSGSQTRSFQYVDDLVDAMVAMMVNDKEFIGPVNIGNPGEFTIKQLAEKVLELIPQSKSEIVYKNLPQDDPKQRKPDISLAMEKLHWQPKVNLEGGLIKTIGYFKKII